MLIKEKITAKMLVAAGLNHIDKFSADAAESIVQQYYQAFNASGAERTNRRKFYVSLHSINIGGGDFDVELWERVKDKRPNTDDIIFKEILRNHVAFTWVGDRLYAQEKHYQHMFNYLKEHDYALAGWPRETYLMNRTSSTGYVIEIQLPFIPRPRG